MGVNISIKKLKIDNKKVTLQLWDLVGEERFRFLLPIYLRGISGGIFMYDITREESLNNITEWLNTFKISTAENNIQIPIIMVGGKLDLQGKRAVSTEKAVNIAKTYGFYDYIECSSKTGDNVEIIFNKLTHSMMENAGFI